MTSLKTQYVKEYQIFERIYFWNFVWIKIQRTAVIRGVEMTTKTYNIVINSLRVKPLDADTELFGAATCLDSCVHLGSHGS